MGPWAPLSSPKPPCQQVDTALAMSRAMHVSCLQGSKRTLPKQTNEITVSFLSSSPQICCLPGMLLSSIQ